MNQKFFISCQKKKFNCEYRIKLIYLRYIAFFLFFQSKPSVLSIRKLQEEEVKISKIQNEGLQLQVEILQK